MEMVSPEKSILSMNEKKKDNAQQTGGNMNNLDTTKVQMIL